MSVCQLCRGAHHCHDDATSSPRLPTTQNYLFASPSSDAGGQLGLSAHPCWWLCYGLYKCPSFSLCNPVPRMIPARRCRMAFPGSSLVELLWDMGTVASEMLLLAFSHYHTLEIPVPLSRATLFCHQPQSADICWVFFFSTPINYGNFLT